MIVPTNQPARVLYALLKPFFWWSSCQLQIWRVGIPAWWNWAWFMFGFTTLPLKIDKANHTLWVRVRCWSTWCWPAELGKLRQKYPSWHPKKNHEKPISYPKSWSFPAVHWWFGTALVTSLGHPRAGAPLGKRPLVASVSTTSFKIWIGSTWLNHEHCHTMFGWNPLGPPLLICLGSVSYVAHTGLSPLRHHVTILGFLFYDWFWLKSFFSMKYPLVI